MLGFGFLVQGLKFRAWGLTVRVPGLGLDNGSVLSVHGSEFEIRGRGSRVQSLVFKIWDLRSGSGIAGSGGLGLRV